MKCLVTGAAGFIGSHLSEKLLAEGHLVIGVDCFTDYYSSKIKKNNLRTALTHQNYRFIEADLKSFPLAGLFEDQEYVFHQAAQAGVRASWGKDFEIYTSCNIEVTQRLLECAKRYPLKKFIYASSSSVYGDVDSFPMREDDRLCPVSPYGVTKLAAENLCYLYYKNFRVPTVSLRYFTVYGPRQRPDMAFHKFIRAGLEGEVIQVYGNGEQTRDFTFYTDAVEANLRAALSGRPGEVYNIGGGSRISINRVFDELKLILGKPLKIKYLDWQKGDVKHTAASISKAQRELKYNPLVDIKTGLRRETAWLKDLLQEGLI